MKLCNRCYNTALGFALAPLGTNLGTLGVFANQDFKEKFQFTSNHAECENCISEVKRDIYQNGKCPCYQP